MNYSKLQRLVSAWLVVLLFVFASVKAEAQSNGEQLFKANCTSCHAIGSVVVGPDLKDLHKRRPTDWIIKWVHSPSAVIKSGDPYAVALFEKFNKTPMTEFPNLSDADIKAMVDYIKQESEATPKAAVPAAGAQGAVESTPETNWALYLTIAVVILLTLAVVLGKAVSGLNKLVMQKEGIAPKEKLPFWPGLWFWMKSNKKIVALILIVLTSWGSVEGWYALKGIGVNEGYQPDQPIAFSHKIHAGENGISCLYCHSGAEKGKTAGVPSANVCMNCHKGIQKGTNTGTEEIAKIYKALDYDPSSGQYGPNQKPIVWTRVHNLPDLAYFNHSQHVTVGKIDCSACHGDVKEMTVAKQFAPLTMGWCINCHRTTPVKMEGNGYYKELHEKLKAKHGTDEITVDKIGGMECSRCHY